MSKFIAITLTIMVVVALLVWKGWLVISKSDRKVSWNGFKFQNPIIRKAA